MFKLRQTGTHADYQTEFERVSNRVTGLSREALKNCYISGLRTDVQNELALHKPGSLHEACALAKLIEDKLQPTGKPKLLPYPKTTSNSWTPPTLSAANNNTPSTSNPKQPPLLPLPNKTTSSLPITKLSPEAIAQRRKEGLSFQCPERFSPGHKCAPPQFLLVVDYEDQEPEPTAPEPPTDDNHPKIMSLSEAAFFGIASNRTLRVTGYIMGKPVHILVDCGSTHSIIKPQVASNLQLQIQPVTPFAVMVGNGQFIQCDGYCPEVSFQIKKINFQIPFFILPVEGADVVLGISWLRTLGRLSADFSIPEMSFTKDGKTCTLTAESLSHQVTSSSLHTFIKHDSIASLHAMFMTHIPTTEPTLLQHPDPQIHALLHSFHKLFEPPHDLPQTESMTITFL